MLVSRIGYAKRNYGSRNQDLPITYFSLMPGERESVEDFKRDHQDLEKRLQFGKRHDRESREKALASRFVSIVSPLLHSCSLDVVRCHAGYGKEKEILVETPSYLLFDEGDPFSLAFKATYWFQCRETVSCISYLCSQDGLSKKNISDGLLDDI
ncbi:hypothetical protein GF342_05240, partial [Candidatus Woesearchaeota archaeon]|nr:hypothetical protein [Candidatus Woesearchaeota archaeon]